MHHMLSAEMTRVQIDDRATDARIKWSITEHLLFFASNPVSYWIFPEAEIAIDSCNPTSAHLCAEIVVLPNAHESFLDIVPLSTTRIAEHATFNKAA